MDGLEFGNHKGVAQHPQFFEALCYEDIIAGYSIPIPLEKIKQLKDSARKKNTPHPYFLEALYRNSFSEAVRFS